MLHASLKGNHVSTTRLIGLFQELESIVLIDPHSHINPHAAGLEDAGRHPGLPLLHRAGPFGRAAAGADRRSPDSIRKRKSAGSSSGSAPLENTVQYSWLIEMCREFFDFHEERSRRRIGKLSTTRPPRNGRTRLGRAGPQAKAGWKQVFLTNDFDDPLTGFDTSRYIPCLRTDDLVFHLTKPEVREAAGEGDGGRRLARRRSCRRRSASCSSISRSTAPGRARFRCPPISSRCPVAARRRSIRS